MSKANKKKSAKKSRPKKGVKKEAKKAAPKKVAKKKAAKKAAPKKAAKKVSPKKTVSKAAKGARLAFRSKPWSADCGTHGHLGDFATEQEASGEKQQHLGIPGNQNDDVRVTGPQNGR